MAEYNRVIFQGICGWVGIRCIFLSQELGIHIIYVKAGYMKVVHAIHR